MLVAAVVDSLSDHTYDGTTVSSSRVNSGHAAFSKQPYDTLSNMKEPTLINNNGKDSTTEKGAKDNLDTISQLQAAEAKLNPIKEYATGITFAPKLDEGMYLVGAGVRKKSIIKVYAVAMYSSPAVLNAVSPSTLGNAARSFNSLSPTTSFVLEMVYSVGAEKIAGAIGESVKPRYHGSPSDIGVLESLIIEGVNRIGGQAVKGTTFRFNCSTEGVAVTVDGTLLGTASFDDLGSAFVDVFMDENAVSATLFDSCLDTWSGDEAKALATSLLELSHSNTPDIDENHVGDQEPEEAAVLEQQTAIEAKLKPIKEYATGITFAPKLDEGMYLVGAGVRKKSIIKVYAVAIYSSPAVLNAVSPSTLGNAARTFNPSSPTTSFVLEMVYSIGAEKIASALAEGVKPRYRGSMEDISALESLIIEGVNKIGGQATQGTVFRFDCSEDGVGVSVNGIQQGIAKFDGLGSAFVDVFMDDNAVSPTLVDSCLDTWSGDEAKLLAASLLEVSKESRAENLSTTQDAELDEDEGEKVVEHELDVYDTNPDVKRELVDQLPSALLDSPSNEAELSTCIGYACREYPRDIPISHIAKIRARDSFVRQQTAALDAAQLDDEIRARASDLAAQRLHILASQVDGDENETAPAGPVKNLLKHLFPVF